METCVRGFSNTFLPDAKVEVIDLQYIKSEELELTWRSARRARRQEREQRIYDEFVRERDVLRAVLQDDPYQFLEQLPEACLKELMDTELQKTRDEQAPPETEVQEQPTPPPPPPAALDPSRQPAVTFAHSEDDSGVFHISRDDKDESDAEPEDEANESLETPHTVRARSDAAGDGVGCAGGGEEEGGQKNVAPSVETRSSNKSSENVTCILESSIYCVKIKELRMKIGDELGAIMTSLETQNLSALEPQELKRLCKRATEFSARFQRIHLYQLQRQLLDMRRHTAQALPFALHTQYQAHLARAASLHQGVLHALQVFNKSIEQTASLRDSGAQLRSLLHAIRSADEECARCAAPHGLTAAKELFLNTLREACARAELTLRAHEERASAALAALEASPSSTNTKRSDRSRNTDKGNKRSLGAVGDNTRKDGGAVDGRLSMYSLDTLQRKPTSGGTSKARLNVLATMSRRASDKDAPKSKKSPASRRPLMRDPHEGKPRARAAHDTDIQTMVEVVQVPSSHAMSCEGSPHIDLRQIYSKAYTSSARTPRSPACRVLASPAARTPRTPHTPRTPLTPSPRVRRSRQTGKPLKPALSNICSDTLESDAREPPPSPVSKIRCSFKEKKNISPASFKQDPQARDVQGVIVPEDQSIEQQGCKEVETPHSPCRDKASERSDRGKKTSELHPAGCEVSRLLRQLCGGDASGNRHERVSGAKNAQLLCINGSSSPRQPSTPQLLRILEETIQKKAPKPLYQKPRPKDLDKCRLVFSIPQQTSERLAQYRTKFVQHMLDSPMYANSAVGKPWKVIDSVSEEIIEELLLGCAREMEIRDIVSELYKIETE